VPRSFLLSLQLADFNTENIAVCFPCALKFETCLAPVVPLRAGRSQYGRARRRRGSALPEEREGRLGVSPAAAGAGLGHSAFGVRGPRRAGRGPAGRETSPGKAPRRAGSKRGGEVTGCDGARAALAVSRRPGGARKEQGSPPRGAGKRRRACPFPRAAAGPAAGGQSRAAPGGCRLLELQLAGRSCGGPAPCLRPAAQPLRAGRPARSRAGTAARSGEESRTSPAGKGGCAGFLRLRQRVGSRGPSRVRSRQAAWSGGPRCRVFRVKTQEADDSPPSLSPPVR